MTHFTNPKTQWLNYLGSMGINNVEFDQEDQVQLAIDHRYQLTCQCLSDHLIFISHIGFFPNSFERCEFAFTQVLHRAVAGVHSASDVPTLDRDGQTLLLQRWLSNNITLQVFQDNFYDFLNHSDCWRQWFLTLLR